MAKKFIPKPYPIYTLTPEAIFYDVKQTLLNMKHPRACSLDINQPMLIDVALEKLLFELEKRYGKPIPEEAGFKGVLTIRDFCEICSKVLTKKIPAELSDVLDFIKYILVASTKLNKCDIANTSKMGRNWLPGQRGLGLDDLDRLQTIMDLEKIYGIELQETEDMKKAKTLIEFAAACRAEINKNVMKDLSIKSDYTKHIDTIQHNVSGKTSELNDVIYTYEGIEALIKQHLEQEYDRYNVMPKNNWFINLGLTEIQRCDFFKWIEQTFEMKLPYFYFENMDALYKVIWYKKAKEDNFFSRLRNNLAKLRQ